MTREPYVSPVLQIDGVSDGRVLYTVICQRCGGYETTLKGDGSPLRTMVHCGACGTWLGRLAALNAHAATQAQQAGLECDRADYLPGGRFT